MDPDYSVPVFLSYYHILLYSKLRTWIEVRVYLIAVVPSKSASLDFHAEEVLSSLCIYIKKKKRTAFPFTDPTC